MKFVFLYFGIKASLIEILVEEEEKRKRTLEYLQQLWNEVLEEDATLLEGAEGSQITEPKYKEVSLEDDVDHWSSKKS